MDLLAPMLDEAKRRRFLRLGVPGSWTYTSRGRGPDSDTVPEMFR